MPETKDESYRRARDQIAAQIVTHQREGGKAVPDTRAAEREATAMVAEHAAKRRDSSHHQLKRMHKNR